MKIGKRMSVVGIAALLLGAVAVPAVANGPGVAMSLMKMDWDARDPAKTLYQEFNIDSTVNLVFAQKWSQARVDMHDSVVAAVTKPDALKSGITLYNVDLRLTESDPDGSVITTGATTGTIRLQLPRNSMVFTARNSITPGYADPTFRATFDIVIDINFSLQRDTAKPMAIQAATARLTNASLIAVNLTGFYAAMGSEALKDLIGWKSLPDQITAGINGSKINVGQLTGSGMSDAIGPLMAGYQSTGGRINNGRIVIAGARIKELPRANVWVRAHWDASYGRVLPNCEPLELSLTMPYAPPAYGTQAPLVMQYRPTGPSGSAPSGTYLACTQTISGFQGVAGTLQYKDVIGSAGGNYTPGTSRSLRIVPATLPTPIIVGDPARGNADFVVEVKDEMHDAKRLLNQAAVLRNPGDPVDRSGKANPGDPANARGLPAAGRVANGGRVADELNPQPLPPGPPPEMKKVNSNASTVAPTAKSSALATGSALKAGGSATRVDASAPVAAPTSAPASSLH
jgi:hypothetical protein